MLLSDGQSSSPCVDCVHPILLKVIHMDSLDSSLQLLRQKRSSALIDTRRIEAKLSHLSNSTATAGLRNNLLCIVGMLRDYIATLDQAIGISFVPVRDLPALRH
jgi:hypothetical protein